MVFSRPLLPNFPNLSPSLSSFLSSYFLPFLCEQRHSICLAWMNLVLFSNVLVLQVNTAPSRLFFSRIEPTRKGILMSTLKTKKISPPHYIRFYLHSLSAPIIDSNWFPWKYLSLIQTGLLLMKRVYTSIAVF